MHFARTRDVNLHLPVAFPTSWLAAYVSHKPLRYLLNCRLHHQSMRQEVSGRLNDNLRKAFMRAMSSLPEIPSNQL